MSENQTPPYPENQTLGYMQMISLAGNRMRNYHTHHNAKCVKCNTLQVQMVRVGTVIFCSDCIQREFSTSDPVRKERDLYLYWMHKQNDEVDDAE